MATHPADLVGYQYAADHYCATDLIERLIREGRVHPDSTFANREKVEIMLDALADTEGIDRYDESSFDSGDFPKVVLLDFCQSAQEESEAEEGLNATRCGECGELLEDELPIPWMDREGNWH